jgi:hypothetical protein
MLLVLTIFTLCSCQGESYDSDFIPNFSDKNSNAETNTDLVVDGTGDFDNPSINPDVSDSNLDKTDGSNDLNSGIVDTETDTDTEIDTDIDSDTNDSEVPTYITVSFNTDGGENIESIQLELGANYILPVPVKSNCNFLGWYYNENEVLINGVWSINNNEIQLLAKWETISSDTYKIHYDFNGGQKGSGDYPSEFKSTDKKIRIGIPVREGNYKFIGWQDGENISYYYNINEGTNKNISLMAIWYDVNYTYQDDQGYQYFLKNDNTLSIVGYVGKASNLSIPSSYKEYTVTEIGPYAFCGYGDKIASIQSSGFIRCDIPDSVIKISVGAFDACDDLKVQLSYKSEMTAEEWTSKLIIEERNNHVLDVINGKRPAIGWNKYWIPGQ